ncbi:zf-C3HC-domain-containing protein [Lentithecium fluviatile CBS 122367]|uniref:Zf-C3HC-domain-containing protein n=1 Tax=Lentithecium fluviatile CBS 122367 TaxID=1168545 RepID=A0A6G1JIG9_9PLEO|nr:zf-C3HC-domain-containing protein [Lentithecium fluviatile CBS 122367]
MSSSPVQEPALATTKRKFDTLLDRLTAGASTTSLASSLGDNASTTSLSHPASKRYRLSDADAAMDSPRVVSGSERIQALKAQLFTPGKEGDRRVGAGLRLVGASKSPAATVTPRKPANFQPYSQDQFLERLKTFANVKKWTNKPDAIGEVEWAKRGWSCDLWNTVACKGGCEQRVAVRLRPKRKDANDKEIEMSEDLSVDIDESLVDKYNALIVDGHHEDCLWRKRGCQEDIYHIPIPSRVKSSAELFHRYRSFQSIANDLPILENLIYPDPRLGDILRRIPSSFFHPPGTDIAEEPPTSPTDIVAFLFAVFGWTGVSESKIALATCNHCFQRNGLWLCTDTRLKEMSQKLDVPIETLRLNLVESHREHCPWKNPDTQRNPTDGPIANMAGWQTQEFMLLGKRKERPRTNIESVDLGTEYSFPRGSMDSRPGSPSKDDRDDGLHEKWKKFKAKLRRTTSRKSLKSVKSVRSGKSGKSTVERESVGENDKEKNR